mmetsp:Transcript_66663/g.206145  ORF Transcript_66663/g.206145 Transcript_66663/m.206145 type:complete len:327 (+) Transcript_66663:418-1398(+)
MPHHSWTSTLPRTARRRGRGATLRALRRSGGGGRRRHGCGPPQHCAARPGGASATPPSRPARGQCPRAARARAPAARRPGARAGAPRRGRVLHGPARRAWPPGAGGRGGAAAAGCGPCGDRAWHPGRPSSAPAAAPQPVARPRRRPRQAHPPRRPWARRGPARRRGRGPCSARTSACPASQRRADGTLAGDASAAPGPSTPRRPARSRADCASNSTSSDPPPRHENRWGTPARGGADCQAGRPWKPRPLRAGWRCSGADGGRRRRGVAQTSGRFGLRPRRMPPRCPAACRMAPRALPPAPLGHLRRAPPEAQLPRLSAGPPPLRQS